ncbi:MAG TPA: TM0106 family RecB-like putative nuclease, partial [Polyangiaceae bacterium]|nr:TM0106 family RecB-like putative nuclease [Polyangiaceae bacterium]
MGDDTLGAGASAALRRYRSPSALVAFTACVHRTELERAADVKLVRKPHFPNGALDALIERGREHERAHLNDLRAQGLEIVEVPMVVGGDVHELAAAVGMTMAAMQRGVDVIYQAAFVQTDAGTTWRGHVDFLRRVEAKSTLGAWSYEPWDAKLAREAKASALLQLCAYAEMIERVQGSPPETVHLVLGGPGRPVAPYQVAKFAPYYRQVRRQFLERVGNAAAPAFPVTDPYPDPVEHCDVCDWSPLCEQRRRADDHVSLVAGISRTQRKALHERAITTLTGLSNAIMPLVPPLERTRVPAMTRVREQARVQSEGRKRETPVWELIIGAGDAAPGKRKIERKMGLCALPAPSPGDLFFDIEGDPFVGDDGREYLFGVQSSTGYLPFWSFDAAGERTQFEQVVDLFHARLRADPDLHVY